MKIIYIVIYDTRPLSSFASYVVMPGRSLRREATKCFAEGVHDRLMHIEGSLEMVVAVFTSLMSFDALSGTMNPATPASNPGVDAVAVSTAVTEHWRSRGYNVQATWDGILELQPVASLDLAHLLCAREEDNSSHNAANNACEEGQKWPPAFDSLRTLACAEPKANTISYNVAINACDKGGSAMDGMAFNACEKGQEQTPALSTLVQTSIHPHWGTLVGGSAAYGTTINACEREQKRASASSALVGGSAMDGTAINTCTKNKSRHPRRTPLLERVLWMARQSMHA